MVESKEEKKKYNFTVSGILNRTVLDAGSNPVDGMVINFVSKKGVSGSLELPMKEYEKTKVMDLIAQKVERLEELLP